MRHADDSRTSNLTLNQRRNKMTIDDKISKILKCEKKISKTVTAIKSALLEEVNRLPGKGDYGYIYKKDIEDILK
jgi:hypothetical protein